MKQIAILASGGGSNAEAIANYMSGHAEIQIACILTNNANAGVIARAERLGIPCHYYSNAEMKSGEKPLERLRSYGVELIVLAGYLALISSPWIEAFPQRIINIHPALLPNYGGKGMYGHHVHEAVIQARESISGITIHLVDEVYDHGRHLLSASCPVLQGDDADSLAKRVLKLEHRHFAPTIEYYLLNELAPQD